MSIRLLPSPTGGYYTYDSSCAGYVSVTWPGAGSDGQPHQTDVQAEPSLNAVPVAPVLTAVAAKAQMQGRRQKQEGAHCVSLSHAERKV